jgi:hypothetical protein
MMWDRRLSCFAIKASSYAYARKPERYGSFAAVDSIAFMNARTPTSTEALFPMLDRLKSRRFAINALTAAFAVFLFAAAAVADIIHLKNGNVIRGKVVRRTSKLKAHDEANACGVGDRVLLMETRPLSATKRWRVVEILEKAK